MGGPSPADRWNGGRSLLTGAAQGDPSFNMEAGGPRSGISESSGSA